jgi:hypothetical protein
MNEMTDANTQVALAIVELLFSVVGLLLNLGVSLFQSGLTAVFSAIFGLFRPAGT